MSGALSNGRRIMVSIILTMVSVMLTSLKGYYIYFQSEMLYGKLVSVFWRRVGVVPHG